MTAVDGMVSQSTKFFKQCLLPTGISMVSLCRLYKASCDYLCYPSILDLMFSACFIHVLQGCLTAKCVGDVVSYKMWSLYDFTDIAMWQF